MVISTGSLVAGILTKDELQRQGEDTQRRRDLEHGYERPPEEQRQTKRLEEEKVAADKSNKKLQSAVADLDDEVDALRGQLRAWVERANGLQAKVNEYPQLMCESLTTIASRDPNSNKTTMLKWSYSQVGLCRKSRTRNLQSNWANA